MVKQPKRRDERTGSKDGKIPGIQHSFYGAIIREARIGPRRELRLRIETWPEGSHRFGGGDMVILRFGAIANFSEVQSVFAKPPADSLHYIRYLDESNERRHIVEMEFDRIELRVRIVSGKLSTQVARPS